MDNINDASGEYSKYIDFINEQIALCPQSQEAVRKFETCKNKSSEQVTGEAVACCGGTFLTQAFSCLKRKIFPLDYTSCHECKEYEQK